MCPWEQLDPSCLPTPGVAGIGETGKGDITEVVQPDSGTPDTGRHFQGCSYIVPIHLGTAGTPAPGWSGGLWDRIGSVPRGEGLRDVGLLHEDGPVFVLGTRDLGPCLLGSGAGSGGCAHGSSRYTAVDSGAYAAGRKGERLGWRNFKDCCRQEGLGTPWSGQSCRSNPIAACLEEWGEMGGRWQGSEGGQASVPLL